MFDIIFVKAQNRSHFAVLNKVKNRPYAGFIPQWKPKNRKLNQTTDRQKTAGSFQICPGMILSNIGKIKWILLKTFAIH